METAQFKVNSYKFKVEIISLSIKIENRSASIYQG